MSSARSQHSCKPLDEQLKMPKPEHNQPLKIAIVGHTNTGKTSLLRTLSRDQRFGQVSPRPSTTRQVESMQLMIDSRAAIELFDTPGMEDSIALLEYLEQLQASDGRRLDGPERIKLFLQQAEAGKRFEQEARVLRQLLHSDAGLYVIDVRDPVLAKYRDELEILKLCAVPLLPLLNFVRADNAQEQAWRDTLARLGMHVLVRFDTVAPALDGERALYTTLATLLDRHRDTFNAIIASHEQDARQRHQAALTLLAELLLEVAACQLRTAASPPSVLQQAIERLNQKVRQREQHCIARLLTLYSFSASDIETAGLPMIDGQWQEDLFAPETLTRLGVSVGGGAAAGAAAGLGIDLMLGGVTLGTAATLGALTGGGLQTLRHFGQNLRSKLTGQHILRVDDAILRLLASRQLLLIKALEARGHAATGKVYYTQPDQLNLSIWASGLPAVLQRARRKPRWSKGDDGDPGRHQAIESLIRTLQEQLN
ncbi:MAG: GTPase/DUF3482 domain-containing protein [Pseudomonadales bacterium]|nr:GTPase/DUF3482 domain-containing protein [Pseudomonadales bacterium]